MAAIDRGLDEQGMSSDVRRWLEAERDLLVGKMSVHRDLEATDDLANDAHVTPKARAASRKWTLGMLLKQGQCSAALRLSDPDELRQVLEELDIPSLHAERIRRELDAARH